MTIKSVKFVFGRTVLFSMVFAGLLVQPGGARDRRVRIDLFPRLRLGQTLEYEVTYHSEKRVKAETPVFAAAPGSSGTLDVHALIWLEILSVQPEGDRALIHARTTFRVLDSNLRQNIPGFQPPPDQLQKEESSKKFVEFTILPDGRVQNLTGLDDLLPDQRDTWQEWLSRFLFAATLPSGGVHLQQKWNSQEPESSSSPIAGLRWLRESTYADDQPCHPVELTLTGGMAADNSEAQTCAVILTTALLKQSSKPANATSEEFKVHELRATGTAGGKNRIVTYVSLTTGLLVRATEEATQQMGVTVAKTDGSNRVHYEIQAKSRSEVVLVSRTPLVR